MVIRLETQKERIQIIDGLRGLAVVLMVAHHLLYNLVYFLGAPEWLFTNPVFDVLRIIFAGLFIFISGISSRFSRGNIRRGLITIGLAMAITLVTYLMDMTIWFGVLHLLGLSMLFFGLTKKLWDRLPKKLVPALLAKLLISVQAARTAFKPKVESALLRATLSVMGWPQSGFMSYDYFPIFPWIFVFLLGTWAGIYIIERKLPEWFYEAQFPLFAKIGRKALVIYLLHQPILYAATKAISYIMP